MRGTQCQQMFVANHQDHPVEVSDRKDHPLEEGNTKGTEIVNCLSEKLALLLIIFRETAFLGVYQGVPIVRQSSYHGGP